MKKILFAVALLFSLTAWAQTGEKNFIDQNFIEVTGKAEMEITPDLIYIRVVMNERDLKGRTTMQEMEQRMMQALRQIGVADKDVTVKDFSGGLRSKMFSKDLMLDKEYTVLVKDGKTAAKVFTEMDKLEISNVSIAKLDNSKMEEYRRDVKIKAIKIAKAKAEALTEAIGQKIGKALYITEVQTNFYPAQSNISYRNMKKDVTEDFENLNFDNLRVDATILCRFELK